MAHLKTRYFSLRPGRFWSEIHAYSSVNPVLLDRYRFVSFVLALGGGLTSMAVLPPLGKAFGAAVIAVDFPDKYRIDDAISNANRTLPVLVAQIISIMVFFACQPLYLALLGQSVVNAKIKRSHVHRVIAYSADAAWLLLLLQPLVVCVGLATAALLSFSDPFFGTVVSCVAMAFMPIGILSFRFGVALKRYLRFPHAAGVAAMYTVIIMLVFLLLFALAMLM
jgi:hypothetical protein